MPQGTCGTPNLLPVKCVRLPSRNYVVRPKRQSAHLSALPRCSHSSTEGLQGEIASARKCVRTFASQDEPSSSIKSADLPGSTEAAERSSGDVSTSGYVDPAEQVDAQWRNLPIEHLRRPGEVGWDIDTDGPTGPEKFDNTWGKRQRALNSTALEVVGMGSWRLKPLVSPLTEFLVAHIEGAWRHLIDDLALYPLPLAWKYIDSLDPDSEYGSWSFQDLEPPVRGRAGWPRLQIENRCYTSQAFRKLHMEVAHRQDGLEVVHCVMFPWVDFDLPILSLDLVAKDANVSLAIIDPCPVSMNRSLPSVYTQICRTLQQQYSVENNRAVPEWGREIFSDQCIMMRPNSPEELAGFLRYAIALTRVHLRFAHNAQPIEHNRTSRMQLISAAHQRYSEKQLLNSKTRRVLEAAFSSEFAEEYMAGLMFDTEEEEEVQHEEEDYRESETQDSFLGSSRNGDQALRTSVGAKH